MRETERIHFNTRKRIVEKKNKGIKAEKKERAPVKRNREEDVRHTDTRYD